MGEYCATPMAEALYAGLVPFPSNFVIPCGYVKPVCVALPLSCMSATASASLAASYTIVPAPR